MLASRWRLWLLCLAVLTSAAVSLVWLSLLIESQQQARERWSSWLLVWLLDRWLVESWVLVTTYYTSFVVTICARTFIHVSTKYLHPSLAVVYFATHQIRNYSLLLAHHVSPVTILAAVKCWWRHTSVVRVPCTLMPSLTQVLLTGVTVPAAIVLWYLSYASCSVIIQQLVCVCVCSFFCFDRVVELVV